MFPAEFFEHKVSTQETLSKSRLISDGYDTPSLPSVVMSLQILLS